VDVIYFQLLYQTYSDKLIQHFFAAANSKAPYRENCCGLYGNYTLEVPFIINQVNLGLVIKFADNSDFCRLFYE
jgi:hypothetical protein